MAAGIRGYAGAAWIAGIVVSETGEIENVGVGCGSKEGAGFGGGEGFVGAAGVVGLVDAGCCVGWEGEEEEGEEMS